MSEFNGKKVKTVVGIVVGVVIVILLGLEFFFLRGETVYSTSARLGDTVKFTVSKPNQPYMITVSDSRMRKRKGVYILKLSVLDPAGKEITNLDETIPRKKMRYIDFTPKTKGAHTIKISGKGLTQNPRLYITILVNDKSISRRFTF